MAETKTYSYNGAGSSDKDTVRFKIQDTNSADLGRWQFTDEDIQFLINEYGVSGAVVEAIRLLVTRYAKLKDEKTDKVDVKWSQLWEHYSGLLSQLEGKRSRVCIPWAGGISREDKQSTKRDPDNVGAWPSINDEDPENLDNPSTNTYSSRGGGDCL